MSELLRLSDYVVRFLARQGVRHIFLVTGGGAMHLNDSLSLCEDIEAVCNSHEQASAMAAETYGKATNSLGVAMVTTGPGGTNAITGVAGAWLDSTPCLFLSGQVKRSDRMFDTQGARMGVRQLGLQELDIVSIVSTITKYAVVILDPASIRYHLEKAVYLARSGRAGPVWLDIPLDVQASTVDEDSLMGFTPHESGCPNQSDLQERVHNAIAALNRSKRPLLFVGNGVRLSGAHREFSDLVEALHVPVAATWLAADLAIGDGILHVGRPGTFASRAANFALQNCDYLLSLGVRLDFSITGYAPQRLARAAYKVVVDIDSAELAKLSPHVELPVQADAGSFLREFLRHRHLVKRTDRTEWETWCVNWNARYPVAPPEYTAPTGRVSVYHLAHVVAQEVDASDVLVSGSSGTAIEIFLMACPVRRGQRIHHTSGLGAMGYGIPASIGACLAHGRSRTICIDGDGGFQFNVQELETVARLELPIKFFVLNNSGYASIKASQNNYFGRASIGCDAKTGITIPDICRVAESYGLRTARIASHDDLAVQVRRVLDTPGPVVCDVDVIENEPRVPRLSSMQLPDGSFVSKPLEDLWPFLERDEFLANMIVRPLDE